VGVCVCEVWERVRCEGYEFISISEARAHFYVTFYMPYAMFSLYVIRYMYCVIMCWSINVQRSTTEKVRVIYRAWGAHDVTIFQVFRKTKEIMKALKRLAIC